MQGLFVRKRAQTSAARHFWGVKLKLWCFEFKLVFRVRDQSLKVGDNLRALCLRYLLESALEMNNLV